MLAFLDRLLLLLTAVLLLAHPAHADEIKPLFLKPDPARDEKLLGAMKVLSSELFRDGATPKLDLVSLIGFRQSVVFGRQYDDPVRHVAIADIERILRDAFWDMNMDTLRDVAFAQTGHSRMEIQPVFFSRWIQEEVAKVVSDPSLKPAVAPDAEPLKPLKRVYEVHDKRASTLPFAKLRESVAKLGYRDLSDGGFEERVLDVVTRRKQSVANELIRFVLRADCGTGTDWFYNMQSNAVFMALLRERRIAEAVGASFDVPSVPTWLRKNGAITDQWRIDLLKFCGLDWEGELLASGPFEMLVAIGSERAAKACLADARSGGRSALFDLERASQFVVPLEVRGPDRVEISAATQVAILDAIAEKMGEDIAFSDLTHVLGIVRRLGRPELKPSLRRLLSHPSTTIQKHTADVLREYGEQIEPIVDAPPVMFRVTLNGQPFASKTLQFQMVNADGARAFAHDCPTDGEGLAKIRRDIFLDPSTRGPSIRFIQAPRNANSYDESTEDDIWTETIVSSPKSFDGVTDVHLSAFRLSFEIEHPPASGKAPRIGRFTLRKRADKDWVVASCYTRLPVLPAAKTTFSLPAIGAGNYELLCDISGCERVLHGPFEVGPQMEPVRITLGRGVDVEARVFAPANQRGAGNVHLYRDGIDVSAQFGPISVDGVRPSLFSGLPEGSYQLRFSSTKDCVDEDGLDRWAAMARRWPHLRDAVDCEGRIVKFVVERKTKSPLDLGRINIQSTPEVRAKAGPLSPVLTNSAGTRYFSERPKPDTSGTLGQPRSSRRLRSSGASHTSDPIPGL